MKKKKVFIALKMSGIAGQEKLAGIFRYLKENYAEHIPWEIQLVRTQGELTQNTVKQAIADGTDGFIVSIPDTEDAVMNTKTQKNPTLKSWIFYCSCRAQGKHSVHPKFSGRNRL